MAFLSYLTYNNYIALGGTASQEAFPVLERKAQRYLDSFTFNRIKKLKIIPDEVLEVLTEYVNRLESLEKETENGDLITRYSNGVETIDYSRKTEDSTRRSLYKIAIAWLPEYLTNRRANFDAEQYL